MAFLEFLPIIGPAVEKLLSLIPDPNERARAKEQFERDAQEAAQKADADQREINKIEAGSGSVFVAGWRPGLGWIGVVALASYYVPQHVMAAIMWVKVAWGATTLPPYPISMDDTIMQLIWGLLGLGAFRTFEKVAPAALSTFEKVKGSAK